MDQIRNILYNTAEFIQNDPGIIESAKTNCPMILSQRHQTIFTQDTSSSARDSQVSEADTEQQMRNTI